MAGVGVRLVKHLLCKPGGPELNAKNLDKNGMSSVVCL